MARERTRSLRSRALSFLARREHSRAELARKLAPHAAESDDIEGLLSELTAKGWVSDERFAEQAFRAKARRFGPRKLAWDLRAKGVEDQAIAAGLRAAGGDGLSSIEAIWRSRFHAPPANDRERARQARFLVGRGFGSEEVLRFLANAGRKAE